MLSNQQLDHLKQLLIENQKELDGQLERNKEG